MFKKQKNATINIETNTQTYTLFVTYKKMKRLIFRYDSATSFLVSAPYKTSDSEIKSVFIKQLSKLLKLKPQEVPPFGETIFYLGEEVQLTDLLAVLKVKKVPTTIEEFYVFTKKKILFYIEARVRHFESVMKISPPYRVRLRLMKSRWGSNALSTHSLTFNPKIIHFHPDIIDSLVVHELGHFYFRNHSSAYYDYLRTILPNYDNLDRKLKRNEYN